MGKIAAPRPATPDRFIECQEAVDGPLQDLIAESMAAGWDKAETLAAVIEVAENLALGMGADQELSTILATVKRMAH